MRSRACTSVVILVALSTPALALAAGLVDWPVESPVAAATDPMEDLRWPHIPGWIAQSPRVVLSALARLSADDPRTTAYRAVALRELNREADARTALASATSAHPELLDDPDIALTAAYLAARSRDYESAVELARRALPRMVHGVPREMLVVEVARWSMARGTEGVPTAIALLREWLDFGVTRDNAPSPLVRATLALALARTGHATELAEATEIARSLRDPHAPLDPHLGEREPLLGGTTVTGEGRAAVGLCLLLAGDTASVRASVVPLASAVEAVPAPWRAFQAAMLANAHRLAPDVIVPADETPSESHAARRLE